MNVIRQQTMSTLGCKWCHRWCPSLMLSFSLFSPRPATCHPSKSLHQSRWMASLLIPLMREPQPLCIQLTSTDAELIPNTHLWMNPPSPHVGRNWIAKLPRLAWAEGEEEESAPVAAALLWSDIYSWHHACPWHEDRAGEVTPPTSSMPLLLLSKQSYAWREPKQTVQEAVGVPASRSLWPFA